MMKAFLLLFAIACVGPAYAQQQPSLTEMRGAFQAAQSQANTIRDMHIVSEAKLAVAVEENTKLRAEILELKKELANAKQDSKTGPSDGSGGTQP